MSDPLTDSELDAIEARCEAAPSGPWVCSDGGEAYKWWWVLFGGGQRVSELDHDSTGMSKDTAAFVAAARTDVPRLLAEVRQLRERCNQYWEVKYYDNRNAPEGDIG